MTGEEKFGYLFGYLFGRKRWEFEQWMWLVGGPV